MRKTIIWVAIAIALTGCAPAPGHSQETMDMSSPERPAPETLEDRFALLALDCVHREYPNKISHVLQSVEDAKAPRELTPAFYGCYDWHSSVHGHWLLVRQLTTNPNGVYADEIRSKLSQSFTDENLAGELAYYKGDGRASFERPYGIAWYLQLVAELDESDDPQLKMWRETLRPLEDAIVEKTRAFHLADVNCPLAYEPSGEDFLSPCLMEADLMRRVLSQDEFGTWLSAFLPQIPTNGGSDWLAPGIVLHASDGKLVHLDGVNLSRAWALEGIASALPVSDARIGALLAAAEIHAETGIAAVSDEHYSGSHWLASFATYLTTRRGITESGSEE